MKYTLEQARAMTAVVRSRLRKAGHLVPRLSAAGVKLGYKQTPEHIAHRVRYGEDHHHWAGDAISTRGGRSRAERAYRKIGPCVLCGSVRSERHHIDGNTANNEPENIIIVCRRCHMRSDGRLEKFKQLAVSNLANATRKAAAKRKKITHCPKGHPYFGANLYTFPDGRRACRKCINDYKRAKRRLAAQGY